MKSNTTQTPQVAPLAPTDDQREVAKSRIQEVIRDWLETRIDEVFQMADKDQEPGLSARISWRDLDEVREQIFGCLANELHYDVGEFLQEILEKALTGKAEGGNEARPSAGVDA